jgi:predicted ABC-type ATPase
LTRPTFHLIAGPNGAGKTTFYDQWLRARTDVEFINPDLLVRDVLGRWAHSRADATLGQTLAQTRRQTLVDARQSLVMESTFSHPSKLQLIDEALSAGYRVVVYHLGVIDADFAVERVVDREILGGHPVPEANVRNRYARNGPLIREAVLRAHFGYVFDNSLDGEPPRLLLNFTAGRLVKRTAGIPDWAGELYDQEIDDGV